MKQAIDFRLDDVVLKYVGWTNSCNVPTIWKHNIRWAANSARLAYLASLI
jgi:hypothetical protein